MAIVDSHCHLADEAFVADLDLVAERAQAAGVDRVLCILSADEDEELERAKRVAAVWPAVVFGAAIHPHRAGAFAGRATDAAAVTERAVRAHRAVAVGEIGLDYHYDFSPKDVQREVFAAQVGVALALDKPVIIHTREATADTVAVLREAGAGRVRGVMHCFSGTADDARLALDLGFFISDAPFLAPVPHRGKRNEPAWVVQTLATLADITSTPPAAMADHIAANFLAFAGSVV